MSVIFEPMTNGGRRLLPDAFFVGRYLVGAGLRRYIRLTQPGFDAGDILGGHDTLGEIVADTTENEKFSMRTWLNRLGLIGDEFKNCCEHLTSALDGDAAFRFGRPTR